MFQVFRLSLLIAIFSIAIPTLSITDPYNAEKAVSALSTYEIPLAYSGSLFESELDSQDLEDLTLGFSHTGHKVNLYLNSVKPKFAETYSFLSHFWGRLQFLNIPPPSILS